MPASESEVLVGRRYLERGFLDAAMKLFVRNAELVPASDWSRLAERLLGRNRIADVVRVCELGSVPLPRETMLAAGDSCLKRKDVDGAMRLYELANADRDRWSRLLDALTSLPDRERLAVEVVERHHFMQAGFGTGVTQSICMLVTHRSPDACAGTLKLLWVAADIPRRGRQAEHHLQRLSGAGGHPAEPASQHR